MIAKGNLHGDGGGLARYLITGKDGEVAELVETRGLESLGGDPVRAFATLQKVAEANTRSAKPFFHAQTRLPHGENLTDAQLLAVADRQEKRLGFTGQPRIVSFHLLPNGDKHLHVGWFRIDLETMRAIDPGMYKNHFKQLCRKLEKEFGLQEVSNVRQPDDRARAADRKEVEEARRLGTDERAIRNAILDCLEHTDGGRAFRAALDERGLMLANGDRRDCFVVIDQAGGHHPLNKKLTGMTLAETRERLGDLDRAQLPGVEQAKERQRQMSEGRTRDSGRDAPQPEPARPPEPARELRPEERHPAYAHYPAPSGKQREAAPPDERAAAKKHPAYAHEPAAATREPERAQEHRQPRRDHAAGVARGAARETVESIKDAGLKVIDAAGVTTSLSSFAESLLFGFMSGTGDRPNNIDPEFRAHMALERMAEAMEAGEGLSAADVAHLTDTHLDNIVRHGDDYIRAIIDDLRRERERDSSREME